MPFFSWTLVVAAALAALSVVAPGTARACEDEESAAPCRLEKNCTGELRELCAREAKLFCERPGTCIDAGSLTMDPRQCVSLNQRIRSARNRPASATRPRLRPGAAKTRPPPSGRAPLTPGVPAPTKPKSQTAAAPPTL
jgi:hypothetical protein